MDEKYKQTVIAKHLKPIHFLINTLNLNQSKRITIEFDNKAMKQDLITCN